MSAAPVMVEHHCPIEGDDLAIEANVPCNWCGAVVAAPVAQAEPPISPARIARFALEIRRERYWAAQT